MPPDDDLERMERPELIRLLKREHQRVLDLEAELRHRQGSAAPFSKGKREVSAKRPGRKPGEGVFTRREHQNKETDYLTRISGCRLHDPPHHPRFHT